MKQTAKNKKKIHMMQRKLLRRKWRKNKRTKIQKSSTYENQNRIFKIKSNFVKKYLEASGFGKGKGERLLEANGLANGRNTQVIDKVIIQLPEIFSISDNSDEVLKFLNDCYSLIANHDIAEIEFDHTTCIKLGLSASTFMDIVILAALEAREERNRLRKMRKHNMGTFFSGKMIRNTDIARILAASGLPKHLDATFQGRLVEEDSIETLDVITGCCNSPQKESSINATKLTEYFEKCLRKEGMNLTEEGNRFFTDLFGEVLSNCEIHGGLNGTWYAQGIYLRKDHSGEMQLMFMNIGETIYDGLRRHSSEETKERLKKYLYRQRSNLSSRLTKEMLCTLFALQDGISRLRDKNIQGYKFRGSGTVTMIETFQSIGAKNDSIKPQMTVVSGSTKIIFDDKYEIEERKYDDDIMGAKPRKVIAFNEENDIYQPPDNHNVMLCENRFPGTVISLRFVLDRDYIEKRKNNG